MIRLAIRAGLVLCATAFASLPAPSPTGAIFHIALVSEIMSGVDGDPDVQYIEVRMDFPNQQFVHDTRLTVFSPDGSEFEVIYLVPRDVPNGGVDLKWIMATQAFADLTGMEPDLIIPAELPNDTAMVCWGAPAFAPPPHEWDPQFPFFYTDCVAYDGYTGGNSPHPPPTTDTAGDGEKALTRIAPPPPESGFTPLHFSAPPDAEALQLRCPTPENNAGEIALFGPDGDSDGLPDCHEGEEGTDPADPDTDGDTFSDGEEYLAGTDPLDPGSPGAAGDVNCDIEVDSIDAALLLQLDAGIIGEVACPGGADVNGDGSANSLDAALVLQLVAGLIPSLP